MEWNTHTCTHTRTHTHTYIHAHIHTYIHTHTHTYTHMVTQCKTHPTKTELIVVVTKYARVAEYVCMPAYIYIYTGVCMCVRMRACMCVCVHVCMLDRGVGGPPDIGNEIAEMIGFPESVG